MDAYTATLFFRHNRPLRALMIEASAGFAFMTWHACWPFPIPSAWCADWMLTSTASNGWTGAMSRGSGCGTCRGSRRRAGGGGGLYGGDAWRSAQASTCAASHSLRVISHTSTCMGPETKCPSRTPIMRMPSRWEILREAWLAAALGTCITGRARVSNQ